MKTLTLAPAPTLQPQQLFLQIGRKRYQVASIAQAVAMFTSARDASGLGASQIDRVTIVNEHGTHLYGISYNGRVWDGDKPLDGMTDPQWVAHVTGETKMDKFEVGKTYSDRAICDSDVVYHFEITARTAKTLTIRERDKTYKRGIQIIDGVEVCKPHGRYSMCAVIRADRIAE